MLFGLMAASEACEVKLPVTLAQPSVRPRATRDTVEFSVKGPVSVNFDEEVFAPGCSVLDIFFAAPSSVRPPQRSSRIVEEFCLGT